MLANQWNGTHTFPEKEEEEKIRKEKGKETKISPWDSAILLHHLLNTLNGIDLKLNQKSYQPSWTHTQNIVLSIWAIW